MQPAPGRAFKEISMVLPIRHVLDTPPGHAALHQSGRLAVQGGDPTGLHRHRAHCAAARNQLHGLQSAFEVVDAFLSPRFFSMLAVMGAGTLLVFWLLA
jgi:hypothetical protein